MRDTEKCSNRVHRSLINTGALVPLDPNTGILVPDYHRMLMSNYHQGSNVFAGMFADIVMGIKCPYVQFGECIQYGSRSQTRQQASI